MIRLNIILPSIFLNKVAAQNCRKRKLDQILTLADEVKEMRDRKTRLIRERDFRLAEIQRAKEKFSQLYRHVFQVSLVDQARISNIMFASFVRRLFEHIQFS